MSTVESEDYCCRCRHFVVDLFLQAPHIILQFEWAFIRGNYQIGRMTLHSFTHGLGYKVEFLYKGCNPTFLEQKFTRLWKKNISFTNFSKLSIKIFATWLKMSVKPDLAQAASCQIFFFLSQHYHFDFCKNGKKLSEICRCGTDFLLSAAVGQWQYFENDQNHH